MISSSILWVFDRLSKMAPGASSYVPLLGTSRLVDFAQRAADRRIEDPLFCKRSYSTHNGSCYCYQVRREGYRSQALFFFSFFFFFFFFFLLQKEVSAEGSTGETAIDRYNGHTFLPKLRAILRVHFSSGRERRGHILEPQRPLSASSCGLFGSFSGYAGESANYPLLCYHAPRSGCTRPE